MTDDCRKWLENQGNEFMQPFAEYLTDSEAREIEDLESVHHSLAGWYSRLSAPGYMDCTDWQGPFDSEDEALEGLYDTYGE